MPELVKEFNWTYSDFANIISVFQFTYAVAKLFSGRFIDWVGSKWGYALAINSWWFPVLLIGIGTSAHQAWSANLFATVSDMFPKKAIASVVGIGGMAGGFGGVFVSKIDGWLFDYCGGLGNVTTGYTIMFVFCTIAYLESVHKVKCLNYKVRIRGLRSQTIKSPDFVGMTVFLTSVTKKSDFMDKH